MTPADLDALESAIPSLPGGPCYCCEAGECGDGCGCSYPPTQDGRKLWRRSATALISEVRRLTMTLEAAQGALAECMAEMTEASDLLGSEQIPLVDKARLIRLTFDIDREIGRERIEMKAEIERLQAQLAEITREREAERQYSAQLTRGSAAKVEAAFRAGFSRGINNCSDHDDIEWFNYQRGKGLA